MNVIDNNNMLSLIKCLRDIKKETDYGRYQDILSKKKN